MVPHQEERCPVCGKQQEDATPAAEVEESSGRSVSSKAAVFFENRMHFSENNLNQLRLSQSHRQVLAFSPLPRDGHSLKAKVVRHRGGLLFGTRFELYIQTDDPDNPVFLAAAATARRTGKQSMKPYYILSSSNLCFDRDSESFLGKLGGNITGTQYVLHGVGRSPKGKDELDTREQLAAIRFKKPTDAPRTMEVAVPRINVDGSRIKQQPRRKGEEFLLRAWGADSDGGAFGPDGACRVSHAAEGWTRLASPAPIWNPKRQVYAIDFHGRVSHSSTKNFQLEVADTEFRSDGDLCMQFGRVEEDTFNMDVGYPLSPIQALGIALSVFDSKLLEALRLYY